MIKNYTKKIFASFALSLLLGASSTVLAQQTYTFTTGGQTGRFGPSQAQINTAYATSNLNGSVTVSNGIQQFVVPPGIYRIAAFGAQGGTCNSTYAGGNGARIEGDFTLSTTSTLNIIVGQAGESTQYNAGAGGGSFVWITGQAQPLVAAGGGGGAGFGAAGVGGATTTAGTIGTGATGAAGTAGNGANPGGGGWLSAGQNHLGSASCAVKCSGNTAGVCVGGASPTTTILYHGCAGTSQTGDGGFGGGSGGNGNCTSSYGGGGGGGYSGGVGQSGASAGGGGGGSYNGGSNQVNVPAINLGDGRVIITELCSIGVSSSSTGTLSPAILCSGTSLTLTTNAVANYSWSTGATTNSIVVSPNTNTVYSVIGTSSLNCTATGIMNVVVSSAAPVLTISSGQNPICSGATTSLSASGAVTYTWSGGITNGQIIAPTVTTNYTVSAQNGCGITTAVRTITVSPLAVTASANPVLVCEGYTTALTAAAAVNGFTWSPAVGSLTGSNVIVAPLANTIYTVTASDGTCTGTQTVLVTTKTTPTIVPSSTFVALCLGESVTIWANGAGSNGSYSWTPGGFNTQSITVAPGTSTLYAVVGTNSLNCSNNTSIPIQVVQGPNMTASTNKAIICGGGSATLTATGASNYTWTGGPNTAGYTVTPTTSTSYTVMGSSSTNSCVTTKTLQVNVFNPSVAISTSTQICAGQTATITASGANSYTWASALGNAASINVTPNSSTGYTVVALSTSVSINCTTTLSSFVQVNALPSVSITATKTTAICKGVTNTLTATGAQNYVWNTAATTNTVAVTPSVTTTYSVIGTDGNGCEGVQQVIVNVNKCTGIYEASLDEVLSLYPNPNAGTFTLRSSTDVSLLLYNALGQEIQKLQLTAGNHHQVVVSDLAAGIYFLKNPANNDAFSAKIIVTR